MLTFPAPTSGGDATAAEEASQPPPATAVALPSNVADGVTSALPASGPPAGLDEPPDNVSQVPEPLADQAAEGATATQNLARTTAQSDLEEQQDMIDASNQTLAEEQAAMSVDIPPLTTVALIRAPTSTDATGAEVPTTLTSDESSITLHVDHQEADASYPVVADPDVQVADYGWIQTGSQPVYRLEPRSHQEWRFSNVGAFYGHWSIFQSGWSHYFWGSDNAGYGLWNVFLPGIAGGFSTISAGPACSCRTR